ncbi:Protein OXIDATIVE STRESS 3 LIKE 2 [Euphorbia peplus]|nr:Protein OXIDATIVE STRESS 3 LIKE 2 [Euphorbia peplus]
MISWIFEHTAVEGGDDEVSSTSSSDTSSIGKNSDWWTSDSESSEEEEVQSAYNGKQEFLDALEEALPIKKGLSEFYGGRSKSFACIHDAACLSSVKGMEKPENAYNRRHRNLMAYNINHVWPKTSVHGGRISKKPVTRKVMTGLSRNYCCPEINLPP